MDKISYGKLREVTRAVLRDVVPLPAPFTIYVEPTNICNFKCVYCPESFEDFEQRSGGLTRMDLQGFERVSDQIKAMGGIKTLNFYMMGEPLVNRDVPQFIEIARRKQIAERIIVTSNGSLLVEETARRIIEARTRLFAHLHLRRQRERPCAQNAIQGASGSSAAQCREVSRAAG